jgi:amino acid adenylation domain-containing protein/non-ribosomal peptide synthase protein (TIGR01720 family)
MQLKNVEDFYPLSPLQQGMLFHSLYSPDSGEYFEQLTLTLLGQLDVAAFERAWQRMIARHPSLRVSFVWEGMREPVQVVHQRVDLPVQHHDWRGLSPQEQAQRLEAFLEADRAQGFELARPALMRIAFLRLDERAYQFVWSHHHLMTDGWCLSLIMSDVFAFYDAICAGQELRLPRSRPYRDYIAWLQQQDLTRAEAFWRGMLKGFAAPTPLGAAQPQEDAPHTQAGYGEQERALPEDATAMLRSFAQRQQLTLNTLVQAAWALLLSRYSGSADVVFGTTVLGRPVSLAGVELIVGQFINTLPVRVQIATEAVLPWLQALQALQVEMRQYEYSPLVQIQGWSDVPRGLPLFESMLVFENYLVDAALRERDRDPVIRNARVIERQSYPLAVFAIPGAELRLRILYNADRFDSATITRMFGHMATLLERMAADPDRSVSGLSLLRGAERHQLVYEWNDRATGGRGRAVDSWGIHEVFAAQATRTPDAIALVYDQRTNDERRTTNPLNSSFSVQRSAFSVQLTYRELNTRANQLARHLRTLGIGPEVLVGLCMERSVEMIVAMLGVLKAGGAYVPLNLAYPPERLSFMLDDSQVSVLITYQSIDDLRLTIDDLGESDNTIVNRQSKIVNLQTDWPRIARHSGANLGWAGAAANLAYLIYTSGSTGRPKGVQICHRSVLSLMEATRGVFEFDPSDVWTLFHSYGFDFSVWEIWAPLLHGSRLVIVPQRLTQSPEAFYALLRHEQVTVLNQTPSALRALLPITALAATDDGLRLRLIMCGGEAFPRELAAAVLEWGVPVWNFYGPTEATVWASIYPVTSAANLRGSVPLGRPLANSRLYLLDAQLQPVPVGVAGELFIGGMGLARGYYNRPALTAERFVPNPFATTKDEGRRTNDEPAARPVVLRPSSFVRLYATGDLARYRPDGVIEFFGRIDDQVKIRGYRIELGEIEALLSEHPAVQACVVLAREDAPGDARLVAYVVPQGDERRMTNDESAASPRVSELRAFLQARLPAYMLPAFVLLDTLPLTPNGKLDRRALPAPDLAGAGLQTAFAAPRTMIEEILAGIWADVLKLDRVGIHDNFFALGGHSLLATQLVSRVREQFKLDLPLRALFQSPTVAELAVEIAQAQGKQLEYQDTLAALPTITPAPEQRHRPFPLNDIQQAYWVGRSGAFELGNVATHSYQEIMFAALDLERLNHAVQRLIERHDMLRAIVLPDGQQQILAQVPPYRIAVADLRGADPQAQAAELERLRRRMSHQVLPPDQWPLFEIRAALLDEQRVRLHLSIDLLIMDAWSSLIVMRELAELYHDPDLALAPLELSFRDYLLAEAAIRDSQLYTRAQAYWWARLPSLPPPPELPLARNPATIAHPRFVRRNARLEPDIWGRLKQRARRVGVTPSALLLTAFAEVLTVWSKSRRFTINQTLFHRLPLHPQVDQLVGDFTSVTLLMIDHSATESFAERMRRCQAQLWEDLDHRYISGVRVLRELARMRGATPTALMPVVFTSTLSLATLDRAARAGLAELGEVVYGISQTPQVWLDHQVSEQAGALVFNWDAVEELFPSGLLDDMFGAYCRLLGRLADEDALWRAPMRQLLPAAQLEQRAAVNATETNLPRGTLHGLFAAQAARTPDAISVVFDFQDTGISGRTTDDGSVFSVQRPASTARLTYAEIARRSGLLARWLRRRGAQPNALVAVVMEKGWEQVVGVLGILQSGAAYLPVDPSLPQERLWYLLEHGQVCLALTQSWLDQRLSWPAQVERLCVDRADHDAFAEDAPAPAQRPADLAYVIYTSGSTGAPKGVMIDHRGAVNTILDVNQRFGVGPADRVLALSALSFDLSVYDIFGTLAAGGSIVFPDAASLRDPAHWTALMAREQVTIWNTVPALMEMLVEYSAGRSERCLGALRLVLLSGDWIPLGLPDQIKALAERAEVIGMGGATEASIWSILYPIASVHPDWKSIPYGRPMANQHFYVLNQALEPCPVWVPGQLYIGGVGLALGYWRDPAKTVERFVPNPFGGERRTTNDEEADDGRRMTDDRRTRLYKTGDMGRYLPDGMIEFLGRDDFQVKIQGHRIELGEIEAALSQHPDVLAALVVAAPSAPTSARTAGEKKHLAAYVVPKRDNRAAQPGQASSQGLAAHARWDMLVAAGRLQAGRIAAEIQQIAAVKRALDDWSIAAICRTLTSLGIYTQPQEQHSRDELLARLGILPRYRSLLGRWLSVLEEAGLLQHGERDSFVGPRPLRADTLDALWEAVRRSAEISETSVERLLEYIQHSARQLPALLTGAADPLELLFPAGSWEIAESLYQFNPEARQLNEIAGSVLQAIAHTWPDRRLRILEIGAGTGGTTASLLPVLPPEQTSYTFSDVSAFFTNQARRKFQSYAFVQYRLMDIDRDPLEQGYEPHGYDLIVAANVLHDARNIRDALRRVRSLLAPHGLLLLLEGTRNSPIQLITTRFIEGLNRFDDERLHANLPLLSVEQWHAALDDSGFSACATFPESGPAAEVLGQRVLVAQAPATTEAQQATSARPLESAELRGFLRQKLPEYMLPASFTLLDALPLSSNGKVDRTALPLPDQLATTQDIELVPPRTPAERILAEIWAEVLGVAQVGIHNNFFALGGDSILGIQVSARAHQAGLALTPRHVFLFQTIAELAAACESQPPASTQLLKPVPLTPFQRWFFEQMPNLPGRLPGCWRRELWLEARQSLAPTILARALQRVLAHHDALRLRFVRGAAGWEQRYGSPAAAAPFWHVDLSALTPAQQEQAMAAALRAGLDLTESSPLRLIFFARGASQPGWVLLIADRLAVDSYTLGLLLEDVQSAYRCLCEGAPVRLPPASASFAHWAEQLSEHAQSAAVIRELDYWLSALDGPEAHLPIELDAAGDDRAERSTATHRLLLGAAETHALLHDVHTAYQTQIDDLLLAALALAIRRSSVVPALLIDLERDGRSRDGRDHSRTAGCFSTLFPLRLDLLAATSPGAALKSIKEQLRRIPNQGIGYGLLRYLCRDAAISARLRALPEAEIAFAYHSPLDLAAAAGLFAALREPDLANQPPALPHYPLMIEAHMSAGVLQTLWTYRTDRYRETTIAALAERFAAALRELIAHCLADSSGGYTPSDFPETRLSQQELDDLMAELE